MKRISSFIVFVLFLLLVQNASAKIWIVNNNPNVTGQSFKTAQEAHDGAAAGDTLYFIGSSNSYGDLLLKKSIIIIGPGYYLLENKIPIINQMSVTLGSITYYKDPSAGAKFMGIVCSNVTTSVSNVQINNIMVNGSINIQKANNIVVTGCLISNYVSISDTCKSIIIKNNIFTYYYPGISGGNFGGSVVISNNILNGSSSSYRVPNSTWENNIFINTNISTDPATLQTMNFSYNMSTNSCLPVGSGNINNIKLDQIFVDEFSSEDGKYQLMVGSRATGTGHNGVDMGVFGGNTPYRLSGIPSIPSIYYFTSGGTGTNAQGIQVQVKIKSNN